MAHMTMMLATSPLLQTMALSTRVCVGIPACDRDRLCSEILHTGTMKLGREWSLPSWHQLGQRFQGKCHLRLKNGLQKTIFVNSDVDFNGESTGTSLEVQIHL